MGVQTLCNPGPGGNRQPCKNLQGSANRLYSRSLPALAVRGTGQHEDRVLGFFQPVLAPVAGHVHGQLEAAPDAQFVEGAAQVILDDLLGGAHQFADLTIGETFPNQGGYLNFLGGQALARGHDFASAFSKAAVASRTRLRPSRIPARRKSVRRCCLTVRGLMLNWPAISLLLQPWTSK